MNILVIGGTRYFGKRFIHQLIHDDHDVTVFSRGQTPDDFDSKVTRLIGDRTQKDSLAEAVGTNHFDVVVDQMCMTASDAEISCEVFKNKTSYYLMTSTLSVYPWGANQKEDAVDFRNYKPIDPKTPSESYAEGKRAAEHVFTTRAPFPVGFVRIPIVLGEDDYTKRLATLINKVNKGVPQHFPNLDARMSYILSADAARALMWMAIHRKTGAYNFATEDTISNRDLIALAEKVTGQKAHLSKTVSPETQSPFGIPESWYMNVDKAKKEGFQCEKLSIWLLPLMEKLHLSIS